MRIISGAYRGRILATVPGIRTRPTQDRVREAVYSILDDHVLDARVLDLFAGTGSLGFEALSRGALQVHFVEDHRACIEVLRRNIDATDAARCRIHPGRVERVIGRLARNRLEFDLVFMDPPYGLGLVAKTLARLAEARVVSASGRIVAEHEAKHDPPSQVGIFYRIDKRKYGDTAVSLYSPDLSEELA